MITEDKNGNHLEKSCTSQILNLTQNIKDGFEIRKITGALFIDLTAAYDTVNHNLLLDKLYKITKNYYLTKVIESMNKNRRFHIRLQDQKN